MVMVRGMMQRRQAGGILTVRVCSMIKKSLYLRLVPSSDRCIDQILVDWIAGWAVRPPPSFTPGSTV